MGSIPIGGYIFIMGNNLTLISTKEMIQTMTIITLQVLNLQSIKRGRKRTRKKVRKIKIRKRVKRTNRSKRIR